MKRQFIACITACLLSLLFVPVLTAAQLSQQTLKAWEQYVQSADAGMQARLRPGHSFLWIDEAPTRRQQLRAGDFLVTGVGDSNPKRVPSGLIHHWIGAVFVPNARLSDVLALVRDYSHYKDYYNPNVIACRAIEQTPESDRFSMLLMNKAIVLKAALESEYQTSYVQTSDHNWYSISTATRVQEVENYGEPNEHKLPAGEGSGYIWRLHGIARYQEADGGVYIELEAIALSRDIPAGMHWLVNPIVRRVSKSAMSTSLEQTLKAVTSSGLLAAHRTVAPSAAPGISLTLEKSSFQK